MPAFASKKQYRMMMAILHGKPGRTQRGDGGPPASVAAKYSGKEDNLPEDKQKALHGGKWDHEKKKKHAEKKHKKLEKNQGGAAVVVVNDKGQILMGRQVKEDYRWSFPGGHVEAGESYKKAAIRELEEEAGLKLEEDQLQDLLSNGNDKAFIVRLDHTPQFRSTSELTDVGFYDIDDINLNQLRDCCVATMKEYLETKLLKKNKSLKELVALEQLEELNKNIIRGGQVADAVYEFRHGDALRLVGNGAFRALKRGVEGMKDDDIRDVKFGSYTLHVRKHANDIYSGRIDDGLKTIHQFINRSLPALTGELMSVFEWYDDDHDHSNIEFHNESELTDDVIDEGIGKLVDNYRKYNIADIYDEMESIREEIRHGNAVDLQQAEQKIMSLFDKIEDTMDIFRDKHNALAVSAGKEIDELENKLLELQAKVDKLSKKPSKIEAYSPEPANPSAVLAEYYSYLSKPRVVIKPNGHIIIDFGSDWTGDDKTNFLSDMKAKALKSSK